LIEGKKKLKDKEETKYYAQEHKQQHVKITHGTVDLRRAIGVLCRLPMRSYRTVCDAVEHKK